MRAFIKASIAISLSIAAVVSAANAKPKSPPPPEPTEKPDFAEAARSGRAQLLSRFYDPSSAEIAWTSGFQWGYLKPIIGARRYGWIACGTVNAKNRLGGYVGAHSFLVFKEVNGLITAAMSSEWLSTCDSGPFVAPGPELANISANQGSNTSPVGVAEELKGLAELRDKGIITQAEFDTQKAKLLAR